MGTLTITIPTFNRSIYLKDAIDSVLKQSYTDFELIILDNASTDGTKDIVNQFKDNRITYKNSNVKLELTHSINRSFNYCYNDYLMIFHDDDIMEVNFLEDNLKAIQQDPELYLVASCTHGLDSNGVKNTNELKIENDIIFKQFEYWKSYYIDRIYLTMPTVIFRTSYLKEYNFKFRDFVGPNIDQYMWFEMNNLPNSKFLLRKEQSYYYRRHAGQSANWDLQSVQLDRHAYWLAKRLNLNNIVKKINDRKNIQITYLFKYCIINNNNLLEELREEGYWDDLNKNLRTKVKITLFRFKIMRHIIRLFY